MWFVCAESINCGDVDVLFFKLLFDPFSKCERIFFRIAVACNHYAIQSCTISDLRHDLAYQVFDLNSRSGRRYADYIRRRRRCFFCAN